MIIMSNYMPVNMSFCAAATAKLHHTGMMLCVLMFIFCLIGLLPEIHSGRSLVAFSDVMTLLEVPHPTGPSVLHWLRPNFPSQRLGDLASKDLEMHGKWKFQQKWWHVDLYIGFLSRMDGHRWQTADTLRCNDIWCARACLALLLQCLGSKRLRECLLFGDLWENVASSWIDLAKSCSFLPVLYLVGFTIWCAYKCVCITRSL